MNRPRYFLSTTTYENLATVPPLDATTSYEFQVPNIESERELQANSIKETNAKDNDAANSSKPSPVFGHDQDFLTNSVLVALLLVFQMI